MFAQEVDDLLDYFEDNYIGRFRHNAPRREPTFKIELWNMFHRSDQELPRTNNAVEGWHRGFQSHVSAYQPTFWNFINILQNEESLVRAAIIQIQGGHQPPPQRTAFVSCESWMIIQIDRMEYLRSIAHNIAF